MCGRSEDNHLFLWFTKEQFLSEQSRYGGRSVKMTELWQNWSDLKSRKWELDSIHFTASLEFNFLDRLSGGMGWHLWHIWPICHFKLLTPLQTMIGQGELQCLLIGPNRLGLSSLGYLQEMDQFKAFIRPHLYLLLPCVDAWEVWSITSSKMIHRGRYPEHYLWIVIMILNEWSTRDWMPRALYLCISV